MNPSLPVLALASGRCGVGGAVFLRPAVLARGMGVDAETAERTAWLARMFAVRDLALGAALFRALRRDRGLLSGRSSRAALRDVLLLGALCDLGDGLAVLGAVRGGHVRGLPAAATLATAFGAAGIGLVEGLR